MNNKRIDQPAVASALDRIGARRILQRIGVVHEPASGLPSDTAEVSQPLADDTFDEALEQLAGKLDRDVSDVKSEAAGYLREMSATHSAKVDKVWDGFGRWLNRAHDVEVDEEQARRVRVLSRRHSLLFLMSHRSYLDGFTLPVALSAHGIDAPFTMGGANLNFFPVGGIASRTGVVFIRRSTSDIRRSARRPPLPPSSHFVTGLMAARVLDDARINREGCHLAIHRADASEKIRLDDAAAVIDTLIDRFGINVADVGERGALEARIDKILDA